MTIEEALRSELGTVADEAPDPRRARATAALRASVPKSNGYLVSSLAAAAVALIALGSTVLLIDETSSPAEAPGATQPAAPAAPGQETPVIDDESQKAVQDFVANLRDQYGSRVQPAVDWDARTVVLATSGSVTQDLVGLDGSRVGGLTVDVVDAQVSYADYEALISAVAEASFPNRSLIDSYNLPARSEVIEIAVRDLGTLSVDERQSLRRNLQNLTASPVALVEAGSFDQN